MRLRDNLDRVAHGVRLVEDVLVVVLVLAMILLAAGQILLRNFWGVGVVWADPLLRVMVLWVGLLGAMAATRHNNHITVDVLSRFLSPRLKRISQWLTGLFASGVCAVLAWHGARFVAMEYEAGTLVFAGMPAWCCELIIPLGFGVMALRFFVVTVWPAPEPA
ncbi:MAG: TRAP transporter small permease [Pseudomonadota bacterium]